ncbi:4'-phosphopantetheinyl transferase family protein [Ignatzschineria sp. LJL83]
MNPVYAVVLEINDENIQWAKTHYPQFWNIDLGNKKRTSYLLSRALLLHTLQSYFQIHQLPEISYNDHQKPIFTNCDISFNLTHSNDYVGLIISSGSIPLGIDIEAIQPRRNFSGLLNRTFQPEEIEWILERKWDISTNPNLDLTPDEITRFFLLWSAKEAYLKADGRGLQGLHSIVLNPMQSTMKGDLNHGALLLSTLSFAETAKKPNSLALYLPSERSSHFSLQILSISSLLQSNYLPIPITWQVTMLEEEY